MIQKIFKQPKLVVSTDSTLTLPQVTDFLFAQKAAFVPIGSREIIEVQKCYPIFFIKDEEGDVLPFAVMGITEDKNLFIDDKGSFKKECYIPALLRVYPFSITNYNGKFSLVIDEAAQQKYPGSKKLFTAKGNLTKEAQKIVKIVEEVYADLQQTKKALRVFDTLELLKPVDITIEVNKRRYLFEHFLIVDQEKIKNLSDQKIAELYRNGILDVAILHTASLSNIERLARMAGE